VGQASGTITRGRNLVDVMLSTGTADLRTQVGRASLSYGFEHPSGWLLTPRLGLSHFRTHRSGYAEQGGAFNAIYEGLDVTRTTLDVAMSAETDLSDRSHLTLSAGVHYDLAADRAHIAGTSDLPVMTTFDMQSDLGRQDLRPFALVGYGYAVSQDAMLSGSVRVARSTFSGAITPRFEIGYEARF
jgi:outer membrane autotransporter protein